MSTALAVTVFAVAYALIATEKVNRVVVALAGAGLMLALRLVSSEDAFHSTDFGIDWEVIFLLLGMMIVVGIMKQTGLFEYLAILSAKKARGQPYRIMAALVVLTAVASAFLDNVTTVLLVAPVTILICERLELPPAPYLITLALASNIGGTATLIGDPPNIIIASQANLTYLDFLANLAPLIGLLLIVFVVLCRVLFRSSFASRPELVQELMRLDEHEAIVDRRLLIRSLAVGVAATIGFVLHGLLHYDPSVVALLGAGVLLLLANRPPAVFLREVEWPTLAFFMGLFIMVGALVKVGVIQRLADAAADLTSGRLLLATTLLLWVSGLLSAVIDNIPYVATMAPVVGTLVDQLPPGTDGTVLWWSLALGADLGGNATAIGASANVVILGLSERAGHRISFLQFTKYGALVALVTLAISMPYLWLRYFVLA
ncbi:MAG TPA: ArsB/NhaD family transporter [Actinomycetota bacterium]|nr:ArsB/NhaD family transporter [Actinomycetota bacterium]